MMKLYKDLLTNLDKTSMQAKKLNLKLENTIDSGKTSIINIKDVKLKIKDLKLNNDKSNKAFEESKLSLNQLLKLTYNYLKNPTPEKALKVKNQINVSNNDLVKANNVFSENKIFADKVVVSFNKYKNGDPMGGPKFPFSTNLLVGLTDGWHLFKLLRTFFIFSGVFFIFIPCQTTMICLMYVFISRILYGAAFSLSYDYLFK